MLSIWPFQQVGCHVHEVVESMIDSDAALMIAKDHSHDPVPILDP
jgi:hypothetical protein